MRAFFILGNHPQLSLAELKSQVGAVDYQPKSGFALLNIVLNTNRLKNIQNRLGGIIKSGVVLSQCSKTEIGDDILNLILIERPYKGKIYFGISSYNTYFDIKKLGLKIKKSLKKKGVLARFVESRASALSSVIVKTNKLLTERGIEVVLLGFYNQLFLGVTCGVQAFDEFSYRDYNRPARDAKSGMLPPKLARMLINLARVNENQTILDPFCGSGTILQEAYLMGYKQLIGTDISQKAIADTSKNLEWLTGNEWNKAVRLFNTDARNICSILKPFSIDAIITEPYLGPPIKGYESDKQISAVINELQLLYLNAFKAFAKIIKPNGRAVIVFPVIKNKKIEILYAIRQMGFRQDKAFDNLYDDLKRCSFLYSRQNQRVKREIFVFNKTK